MKYLILLAVLIPNFGVSQSINEINIADITVEYARILAETIPFKSKQFIYLDFGHEYGDHTAKIKDDKSQPIEFKSMTDAINFMEKLGYELNQAYGVNNGTTSFFHYIMKRKPHTP